MKASATFPGRGKPPAPGAEFRVRRRQPRAWRSALAVLCGLASAAPAWSAGALVPGESVVDRSRPEVDATGLPVGAFRVTPSLELSLSHDSNVFAQEANEVDDRRLVLRPRVALASDWSRHSLGASAQLDAVRYDDNDAEDVDDLRLAVGGRIDLTRRSALRLGANFDALHEDRFSPDDVNGFEPTEFDRSTLSVAYALRSGRLAGRVGVESRDWDYEDVLGASGIVNNDDRDRTHDTVSGRLGFEVREQLELSLRTEADRRDYDAATDDNGFERSSEGLRAAIGVEAALTGASYVDAYVGYAERDYDDARLGTLDTPWFGGRLVWNPTGLTTVTVEGRRVIEETTFDGSPGYVATRFGAGIDHELRRNLLLHASAYVQENDFEQVDREDDNLYIRAGATFMMNRYLWLVGEFSRRERDVTPDDARDYDKNLVTLTVRMQR